MDTDPLTGNPDVVGKLGRPVANALAAWAIDTLVLPPANITTGTTRVSATKVREGRAILEAAGIDWRALKGGDGRSQRASRADRDTVHGALRSVHVSDGDGIGNGPPEVTVMLDHPGADDVCLAVSADCAKALIQHVGKRVSIVYENGVRTVRAAG